MVPESTPSDVELAKRTITKRKKAIRNRLLPLCQGYREGERSESSGPVLFQDHIGRFFAMVDAGVYRPSPGLPTESGKWLTRMDRFSGRRRHSLNEIIATHVDTHHRFFVPTPVTVHRIKEEWTTYRHQKSPVLACFVSWW